MSTLNTKIPLTNVGGGVLTGAVVTLLLLAQHDALFEFDAVSGAIGIVLIGLAGYLPRRYKSFIMATAAFIAALVASVLGWAFFNSPFDPNIVSFSLASFVVALFGYVLPAQNPDTPPVVLIAPERTADSGSFASGATASARPRRQ